MNREHFLIDLNLHLRQLSSEDRQKIIDKYQAIFDQQTSEGLNEYQITKNLGSPKTIAKSILNEFNIELKEINQSNSEWVEFSNQSEETTKDYYYNHLDTIHTSAFTRFLQISGLICLNIFLMIWLFFSWMAFIFSGWVVTFVLILSPILGVISLIQYSGYYGLFQLSVSLCCFGVGLIGFIIVLALSKISFKLVNYYFKWNLTILKGGQAIR